MNAMTELVKIAATIKAKIRCAYIYTEDMWQQGNGKQMILRVDHSLEEFEAFLKSLDFEYDHGYGGQELFGIVWFEDGTWMTRGEYDGSEWWDYHVLPEIPDDCQAVITTSDGTN